MLSAVYEIDLGIKRGKRLAAYKIPKSVEFVDAIPRTPMGKILKKDLRKKYWGDSSIQVS